MSGGCMYPYPLYEPIFLTRICRDIKFTRMAYIRPQNIFFSKTCHVPHPGTVNIWRVYNMILTNLTDTWWYILRVSLKRLTNRRHIRWKWKKMVDLKKHEFWILILVGYLKYVLTKTAISDNPIGVVVQRNALFVQWRTHVGTHAYFSKLTNLATSKIIWHILRYIYTKR